MDSGVTPFDGFPLPSRLDVVEVGPRDGLQHEFALLPLTAKLELLYRLVDAGHAAIEVTGFSARGWVPQLADAEQLLERFDPSAPITQSVLIKDLDGLDRVPASLDRAITVQVDMSSRDVGVRASRNRQVLTSTIVSTVVAARDRGFAVRGRLTAVFGVLGRKPVSTMRIVDLASAMLAAGCTELSIGDTSGLATPPRVTAVVDALVAAGISVDVLAVHFHDTYGQASANTFAAIRRGIRIVETSVGGLGWCPYSGSPWGNPATEDLLWQAHGLGIETGIDVQKMVDTNVWLARDFGLHSKARTAIALGGTALTPSIAEKGSGWTR